MKSPSVLVFVFFSLILNATPAFAKIIHWPEHCTAGELHIKNKSNQTVSVWLQKFTPYLSSEIEHQVEALSTLDIRLESTEEKSRHSLMYYTDDKQLSVVYSCGGKTFLSSGLDGGVLTFKKNAGPENKLWLQNVSALNEKLQIDFFDDSNTNVHRAVLNLNLNENNVFNPPEKLIWSYVKVQSNHKFSAFLLTSDSAEAASQSQAVETPVDDTAFYFLVGPRSGPADNFVVRITDKELLKKARDLIKNPGKEKMLFARLQKDHQGFNRNFESPNKSHWSWSAAEVTGFDDFGSTKCNGHPQAVEDRVDQWVESIGYICFWDYRVKSELTPSEVASGKNASSH